MPPADAFPARYGPCALVAGAAVGLGAEYARQLAARDLDLLLLDREPDALAATAADLRARHARRVDTLTVDLARPDLLDAAAPALARADIGLLVYNAAVSTIAPFAELDLPQLQRMLDVNVRGALLLVHALVPRLVARGRGGIVLMSSLSGNVGSSQLAIYAATKAFLLVLGDALWMELRPHGVDVLVVQPGSTRTPGWLASQPGQEAGDQPVMEPADVVREALATLGVEPHVVAGEGNRLAAAALAGLPRRRAIELVSAITASLVPNHRPRA